MLERVCVCARRALSIFLRESYYTIRAHKPSAPRFDRAGRSRTGCRAGERCSPEFEVLTDIQTGA